jgi:hypothetical protein
MAKQGRTRRWDGKPESKADRKFFDLRESGYKGPIDQDGNKANCLVCDRPGCTRQGFAGRCS